LEEFGWVEVVLIRLAVDLVGDSVVFDTEKATDE